jgi:hypothetical protein
MAYASGVRGRGQGNGKRPALQIGQARYFFNYQVQLPGTGVAPCQLHRNGEGGMYASLTAVRSEASQGMAAHKAGDRPKARRLLASSCPFSSSPKSWRSRMSTWTTSGCARLWRTRFAGAWNGGELD